jgi:hypothetical protein
MTTWPSNQSHDQWSAATMAAYIQQTVSMREAAELSATPTAARPYVGDLAWSAEPPEYASPLTIERRRWFTRSRVLTFVGGGLVAAAAAGLFGALHGAQSTPVDMTNHSAPPAAPVAAPAKPAPTPGKQPMAATTNHSVIASHRASSRSASHHTPPPPPQYSTPPSSGQNTNIQHRPCDQNTASTPPTWNRNFFYWLTHRRDHDGSGWTHDQSSDDHSMGSGDNGHSN